MGKKRKFWAVAYGHVIRWAEGRNEQVAMMNAFGVTQNCTVAPFPSNPKYMSFQKRSDIIDALMRIHKERTGNTITN